MLGSSRMFSSLHPLLREGSLEEEAVKKAEKGEAAAEEGVVGTRILEQGRKETSRQRGQEQPPRGRSGSQARRWRARLQGDLLAEGLEWVGEEVGSSWEVRARVAGGGLDGQQAWLERGCSLRVVLTGCRLGSKTGTNQRPGSRPGTPVGPQGHSLMFLLLTKSACLPGHHRVGAFEWTAVVQWVPVLAEGSKPGVERAAWVWRGRRGRGAVQPGLSRAALRGCGRGLLEVVILQTKAGEGSSALQRLSRAGTRARSKAMGAWAGGSLTAGLQQRVDGENECTGGNEPKGSSLTSNRSSWLRNPYRGTWPGVRTPQPQHDVQ